MEILDLNIFYIFRLLKSFPCTTGVMSSRFDCKGTRLLCSEFYRPLTNYLVAPSSADTGKMQFTADKYIMQGLCYSRSPCCFAGDNEELVVGASDDQNIYIWSAPAWDGEIGRSTNNTPHQSFAWSQQSHSLSSL